MRIEWNDSYKIGDAVIDAEHEKLFALANRFLAAEDKATQSMRAMQLYQHTREHFEHEENLMRQLKYPDYPAHVESHNQLIGRLNTVSERIRKAALTPQDVQVFMTEWALHHIPKLDAQLSEYVAAL
jgi:hemerythrin